MKQKKSTIKLSTVILITMMLFIVTGVFASIITLKGVYDKRDKGDLYWNYNKILEKPFKFLKIKGGNVTNIIFEQNKKSSVRILNYWNPREGMVNAYVKNDTLFLTFKNKYDNLGEKYWMQREILVRIFAPQLLAVEGWDTNFEMQKMKQRNFNINLKGKSRFEVETYERNMDTLNVTQRDSSQVVFEVSPDLKGSQEMCFKKVTANQTGYTLLDVGRSYINDLKLNLADSSAVILNGKSLKTVSK
ncbi:MAG: GIN domain-containing protein [Sphingobacteriales bacterium]